MDHEEFGDGEAMESSNIQGVLGDRILTEAVDPTQDPNIMVGEVEHLWYI